MCKMLQGQNGTSRAFILEQMQAMKQNGLQSENEKMSSSVICGDSGKFCGRVGDGLAQKERDRKEEYLKQREREAPGMAKETIRGAGDQSQRGEMGSVLGRTSKAP